MSKVHYTKKTNKERGTIILADFFTKFNPLTSQSLFSGKYVHTLSQMATTSSDTTFSPCAAGTLNTSKLSKLNEVLEKSDNDIKFPAPGTITTGTLRDTSNCSVYSRASVDTSRSSDRSNNTFDSVFGYPISSTYFNNPVISRERTMSNSSDCGLGTSASSTYCSTEDEYECDFRGRFGTFLNNSDDHTDVEPIGHMATHGGQDSLSKYKIDVNSQKAKVLLDDVFNNFIEDHFVSKRKATMNLMERLIPLQQIIDNLSYADVGLRFTIVKEPKLNCVVDTRMRYLTALDRLFKMISNLHEEDKSPEMTRIHSTSLNLLQSACAHFEMACELELTMDQVVTLAYYMYSILLCLNRVGRFTTYNTYINTFTQVVRSLWVYHELIDRRWDTDEIFPKTSYLYSPINDMLISVAHIGLAIFRRYPGDMWTEFVMAKNTARPDMNRNRHMVEILAKWLNVSYPLLMCQALKKAMGGYHLNDLYLPCPIDVSSPPVPMDDFYVIQQLFSLTDIHSFHSRRLLVAVHEPVKNKKANLLDLVAASPVMMMPEVNMAATTMSYWDVMVRMAQVSGIPLMDKMRLSVPPPSPRQWLLETAPVPSIQWPEFLP